ncbi:hypothetical protein [Hydrogenophaga sp.]|uniref:hypothetical protein n=1 Tax=Hydrogenophaga sp. TaxID=1904254 RepID=UPI003F6F3A43
MNETTEVLTAESGTVALLNKGEIDMQIATAHKYPRSIKAFRNEALAMVTLNETIAQECIYSLPRDGKNIEGPSARFAEVIVSAWGNSRAGARVVSDQGDFVTAQAVFHDLEKNVAITYEVQRRIVDRQGRRFKPDMIGVTANAACSIALRNSILKGVPKAFWADLYESARSTAIGDMQTLANRRARALGVLQKMGVQPAQVFLYLGIAGEEDLTLEHLGTLFGITTAIRDGDTTPEQAFAKTAAETVDSETLAVLVGNVKAGTTVEEVEASRKAALDGIKAIKDDGAVKAINQAAQDRKSELGA